jgi:hypothetical protein
MSLAVALLALPGPLGAQPLPDPRPGPRLTPYPGGWETPVIHAFAMMTAMRTTAAVLWPQPFADMNPADWADQYAETFSRAPRLVPDRPIMQWDGDGWKLNTLGHGAFGSELYLRARTCRKSAAEALLFASAASATWEYVFEGNAVQPSAQDLWYTPIAGLVIGELRFQTWRAAGGVGDPRLRRLLRTIVDPLGEFERHLGAPC